MSVVTPTILSQGQVIDPTYGLLSLDVRREVNRIPRAELCLLDGNVAKQEFALSDTDVFAPGREIEIKLRYEGGAPDATVFKGLVVRHGVESSAEGSLLMVGLKDAAVKLTGGRRSAVFREQADHEIIGGLVQAAGLTKGALAATEPKHAEIVQYDCTDWDFIVSRADVQGLLVLATDGAVSLVKPDLSAAAAHTFEWGIRDIYDFEMEADGGHQFGAVESVAWSLKDQKLTPPGKAQAFALAQGDLDGAEVAKALGFATRTLSGPVPLAPEELTAWADARMVRGRLAMLRGRISVPGLAEIKLLEAMAVQGVGKRWNGTTLITGLRHRVDGSGWQTDVQFGLPPEGFCRQENILGAPAAGLLPAVSGLQIGVVAAFEEDPDKEVRLKVLLPGVDAKEGTVWARLASPDAGKDRGFFFRPEAGDEVVVGFFNNDPRHPVVLGALYGSKNAPPAAFAKLSADNPAKGIVTKKGTTLAFLDGDKATLTIETAQKNKILLDDDGEAVVLADQHGNSVTLNQDGIAIKSAKDVMIDASGNVEIKGAKVDVK